jgi:hypothetical protein
LVIIGVAGEIQFSRMGFRRDNEIKRRSDEKLAEANDRAAQANERAAQLEKDAAEARQRTADIERVTAWRSISPTQVGQIARALHGNLPPVAFIEYNSDDPEYTMYSRQLEQLFILAGCRTGRRPTNMLIDNEPVFGILVTASPGVPVPFIIKTFADAGITLSIDSAYVNSGFFLGDPGNPKSGLRLYVGHKPPVNF